MASLTRWTWVWVNSGSWWWTGRPGVLQFMGLQRVRHNWVTGLNWTELNWTEGLPKCLTLKKWMLNAYREKQCTVQKGPWSLFYFYFPKPHKYLSKIWLYFKILLTSFKVLDYILPLFLTRRFHFAFECTVI